MSCEGCNDSNGITLPIGPTGSAGPQGPQGPQGDQGIQGPQGDIGPEGPQGDPGADGADGADGNDGADGADGAAYHIIPVGGIATRFFEATATSYGNVLTFIYPGSATHAAPTRIKLVAFGQAAGTQGSITITDDTNSLDWIASTVFTPGTTVSIVDLGVPSNIDTGESLIRVAIEGITALEKITVISLLINYA